MRTATANDDADARGPYLSEITQFYAVALVTIFLISLLKGAFGGGFALIGVPILSIYVPPVQAATIIAPLVCLMDVFAVIAYPPKTWDGTQLRRLLPGALVGMALGAVLLGRAPESLVALTVGLIAVTFSGQWLVKRFGLLGATGDAGDVPGAAAGYFWSGLSGFTGLLAHAGGPPLSVYLLRQRLSKTTLAGTQTVFFMVGNYAKLIPYLLLGQLDRPTLVAVAVIAPSVPIGVWSGRLLHGRLHQDAIYLVCYVLVFLAGLDMLYRLGRGAFG